MTNHNPTGRPSSIRITQTEMTLIGSTLRADACDGGWRVSWLPGRVLNRDDATTALVLGHVLSDPVSHSTAHPLGRFAHAYADELGLTVRAAVALLRRNRIKSED
jgi:hypothetical protein